MTEKWKISFNQIYLFFMNKLYNLAKGWYKAIYKSLGHKPCPIRFYDKKVEFELKYSAINCNWQKEKTLEISVFLLYWFVLNPYFTSVKITCLRNFGEYFFNWRRSGVLRLFFEVRYKRSPDSLCSSVIFTRMVSPFYYSADAALAILRPL